MRGVPGRDVDELAQMKCFRPFSFSLLERFLAGLLFIDLLGGVLIIAFLIRCTGGRPVFVKDEWPPLGGVARRSYRFHTTGPGTPEFKVLGRFLRWSHADELPVFWNIVLGEISFQELRQRNGRSSD